MENRSDGPTPRTRRGRLALSLAIAVLLIGAGIGAGLALSSRGGSGPNAAPAGSLSPSPALLPPDGFSATVDGLAVRLSWSPLRTERDVDVYELFRDGAQLTVINVPATSYVHRSVEPGRTYAYAIEAGRAGTFSDQVNTTASIPTLPLGHAVLRGTYDATGRLTSETGYTKIGNRFDAGWRFTSKCVVGPCNVKWTFVGFEKIKGSLSFAGRSYSGTATGPYDVRCAGGAIVVSTVSVALRVVKARAVDGRWVASRLSGTVTQSESSQLGCVSSRSTANIKVSLVG